MDKIATLSLKGLTKRYGDRTVLDDVTLSAAPGKVTAILGTSGAGKSTLLRLVAGLEPPTAGTISSGDHVLSTNRNVIAPEKRSIGLVFQDFALFPNMSVLENVKFGLKTPSASQITEIAQNWIDALGMGHRSSAYPHQMSGGEQQRVAIARALAAQPSAIMLDEPFSGLDPKNRDDVRDVALAAIRTANIPAILVTHDPAEALAHSDQIAVLEAGKLLQYASPDEIFLNPIHISVAKAFGPLHSLSQKDMPEAWRRHFRTPATNVYYRDSAFTLSERDDAVQVTIRSIHRVGSEHQICANLPSGIIINAKLLFSTPPEIGETLRLAPLPHLFYVF